MKLADAVAEILKREGTENLFAYPRNGAIDAAAKAGIRPIIVRQERVGLHMADALSRMTRGSRLGVFCMQQGPGSENAFGGVAQAFGESIPILVIPQGFGRATAYVRPNFNSSIVMSHVAKHAEPLTSAAELPNVMRRAFTQLRNGRGGPAIVEIPRDMWGEEVPEPLAYAPVVRTRYGPDPQAVEEAASIISAAERPVIYAGQGVHWANAYAELRELAELLIAPVCTSLAGKSTFDETHPFALGTGGASVPLPVHKFLQDSDLIIGMGCSFTETSFGVSMPKGKRIIHATLDPADVNKSVSVIHALIGDAKLTLRALVDACKERRAGAGRTTDGLASEVDAIRAPWMAQWLPKLTSSETPLNPYRVLWDLQSTVDPAETIITHDAGSPRDQLTPFWRSTAPLSYIGWGKTTQLGYGLGLAMGAKIAHPEKLCINVWGDAAIGFTGMDFETAVREHIPILSILLNNSTMAVELSSMPEATKRYDATRISGDYSALAKAFGGYGERVTEAGEIVPAIRRGIEQTRKGVPALLEFITSAETAISKF